MRTAPIIALAWVLSTAPSAAYAQRFAFERSFDLPTSAKLDVTTVRGKIDVVAGESGRVVVTGDVTVRVAWDAPANAVEIARQVAANPPIAREADTVRLRPPSESEARRAVTVSYQVRVPPTTEVLTKSDSGATSIRGVIGKVDVHTQSGAIELNSIGNDARVSSGVWCGHH